MSNTQLTLAKTYDPKNIKFLQPVSGNVKDTTIKFRRIPIQTVYPDGTTGDLIFQTQRLFSLGVCENIDPNTKKQNGYVFPIVLVSKEGETAEEREFIDTFNKVIDTCKKYLLENKKELKLHDLESAHLNRLNPIWRKRDSETGEIEATSLPTLYVKVIVSKKDGQEKIISNFYDKKTGKQLEPLSLLKQLCYTDAAIKVESIFLGGKGISMQVKLYEADIEVINTGNKKRLIVRESDPNVSIEVGKSNPLTNSDDGEFDELNEADGNSVGGSIEDDEAEISEEEVPEPEPIKKPMGKKVLAKKK